MWGVSLCEVIETPMAGKSASLTFRLVLRATQPITMSKMFLAASAMSWMGSAGGGCMTRSIGEAGMHRSEAEGRFGVAEPEGRASGCVSRVSGR